MSGTDDIYKDQGDEVVLAHQEEREANLWLGGRGARLTPSQKKRIREFCLKREWDQVYAMWERGRCLEPRDRSQRW